MNTHSAFCKLAALLCACALLCPGAGTAPGGETPGAATLAPHLSAASRVAESVPAAPLPMQIRVAGKPLDAAALAALQARPLNTIYAVVDGIPARAEYAGETRYAILYRFSYRGRDYVVKLPTALDTPVLPNEVKQLPTWWPIINKISMIARTPGGTKRKYIQRENRKMPEIFRYSLLPEGAQAVLENRREFYEQIEAFTPFAPADNGRRESTLRTCRQQFLAVLPNCAAAKRDADGGLRACAAIPMQTYFPLFEQDPDAATVVPYAVVQPYTPNEFNLSALRGEEPRGAHRSALPGITRAAVAQLRRIHTQLPAGPLIHGAVMPTNLAVGPEGRASLVNWTHSHTPGELRDQGEVLPMEREFASPARAAGRAYNPFFDDYYGLAASLAWALTGEDPGELFSPDGLLNTRSPCYRALANKLVVLGPRMRIWCLRYGLPDVQAFTLTLLEACGMRTDDLPGYLVLGSPEKPYLTVDEIHQDAALRVLDTAA